MANENNILIQLLDSAKRWRQLKPELSKLNTTKSSTSSKKTIAGKVFEYFCKYYFTVDPTQDEYESVWMYEEIPENIRKDLQLPPIDHGIDILLKNRDGDFCAVQCKFKNDETKSLSWSGDKIANVFALGTNCRYILVISNCSEVTKVAQGFEEKYIQILNDGLTDITEETFERILELARGKEPKKPTKYNPRSHQEIAIQSVINHFKSNDRGQLILPCGAGKTLTSLWIKERMNANHTLVLVPSLALLKQIKNDWAHQKSMTYRYICVCSERDIDSDNYDTSVSYIYELGGTVTTDSMLLQKFMSSNENSVVYCTYQSSEVVKTTLTQIPHFSFDLAICDEAHRTAGGSKSTAFGIIHDNKFIPCKKRLYMTATPRVLSTQLKNLLGESSAIYDMSNPNIFGNEAYRMSFGEAIDKGILVDYKILGIGVTDEEIKNYIENREITETHTAEEIAQNYALDLVMKKYGASHALTFHSRVKGANEFSKRHSTFFKDTFSKAVDGKQSTTHRKRVLNEFKNHKTAVISNARCLTEGVDVPTIDLIYFCDPKSSKIDIVQASGRALRKDPSGKKELGFIVVPLFHHIDEDIQEVLAKKPIYKYLIQIVRSLCDQDERLETEITNISSGLGKRNSSRLEISNLSQNTTEIINLEGLEEDLKNALFDEIIEKAKSPELRWKENYAKLKDYYKEHGNCNIPARYKKDKSLGTWVVSQRVRYKNDQLSNYKIKLLEELDFEWQAQINAIDEFIKNLAEFRKKHGHINVPRNESKYKKLAQRLNRYKTLLNNGKVNKNGSIEYRRQTLSKAQVEALTKLGLAATDTSWEYYYQELKHYYSENGHLNIRQKVNSRLYGWCRRQIKNKDHLTDGQVRMLVEIHFSFEKKKSRKPTLTDKQTWDFNLSKLENFYSEHHHANIPRTYSDKSLANFVARVKHLLRNSKLDTEKSDQLKKLGLFEVRMNTWDVNLDKLKAYKAEFGNINVPRSYHDKSLVNFVGRVKHLLKNSKLDTEKSDQLKKLGLFEVRMDTWDVNLDKLKAYKAEFGNINVPRSYHDKSLVNFVRRMKFLLKNNKLDKVKQQSLIELGLDQISSDAWVMNFKKLSEFYLKNHHSSVPKDHNDSSLYNWVLSQRTAFRKNKISENQINDLHSVDFVFDPHDAQWYEMFQQLVEYKKKFGHTNVSQLDQDYQMLGRWLNGQRGRKKGWKSGNKVVYLRKDRENALDELGIIWNPKEHEWNERIKLLKEYKERFGHFDVKQSDEEYSTLYYFLRNLRIKGLSREKLKDLANIGLDVSEINIIEE